jgi:hypothetical protein
MKATIIGLIALIAGIVTGVVSTRRQLPDGPSPVASMLRATGSSGNADLGTPIGPVAYVVGGERFHFGTMDRYGKMSHEFVLRNRGDAPLILEKGGTTCKCTGFELGAKEIAPGEEAPITLEWTAKTEEPEFSQSAEIKTNDPKQPVVTLRIEGGIRDSVRPDRRELSLGSISLTEPTTAHLNIYAFGDRELKVLEHSWSDEKRAEMMEVEFRPLDEASLESQKATSGVEMIITTKPGLPLGSFEQKIRLTTSYDEVPPLEIPIVGRVIGDISVVGPRYRSDVGLLALGLVPQSTGAKATLQILIKGEHRDQTELTITSVEPENALQASLGEPNRDGKLTSVPLVVEVPAGTSPISYLGTGGSKAGKIVIGTNHPDIKKIELEVRFAVEP